MFLVWYCSVSGFQHTALDDMQQEWHKYTYPYKLASYRNKLLSDPVTIGMIDYNRTVLTGGAAHDRLDITAGAAVETQLLVAREGSCDAVAVWVDYELLPGGPEVCGCDCGAGPEHQFQFPPHLTVNVKFFPASHPVKAGDTLTSRTAIDPRTIDFVYDFVVCAKN
jgi:hypothetical protein